MSHKSLHMLLSSLCILYFQLIIHIQPQSSTTEITSQDKDDSTQTINTINKLGHILNADPPDTDKSLTTSETSLQDEVSQLHEPDYLLIGVVKSGSTSLYHYMVQHPQITGVEQTYLLPQPMRNKISNIIRLRRAGKIKRISKPKTSTQAKQTFNRNGPQKLGAKGVSHPQTTVKNDIYEINNFDLARMMKPIIDQKEVRFFDSFWYNHLQTITNHSLLLGWKWYLEVFNQDGGNDNDNILRGEASPTYFASSQFTAERIKLWLPNVKLILLMRNPVRRFVSHLKMIKENHAANMRFRKQRQIEMERTLKGKGKTQPNNNGRRVLLDNMKEQMNTYWGGNEFNNMNNMQTNMNPMGYNVPFTPRTRYGSAGNMKHTRYGSAGNMKQNRVRNNNYRRKKQRGNNMQRFTRTRGKGNYRNNVNNMNSMQYQQLLNELQNEIDNLDDDMDESDEMDESDDMDESDEMDESEEEMDDELDESIDNEMDEDDIDESGDNDEYINNEITQNEIQRGDVDIIQNPLNKEAGVTNNKNVGNNKKPVNKMEKIIGSIYRLSIYQVILVSNANPDSSTFYQKRWGIGRDVSSFINRLLFGGIYTMRMKEWLKRFDNKHLFYRESSQLFDDPVQLMSDLEEFLGVTPFGTEKWKNITSKVYNVKLEKGKGYQHGAVDAEEIEHWDISVEKETKIPHPTDNRKWQSLEIIDMLRDYYRPHNKQLSQLFDGKKYKDWDY